MQTPKPKQNPLQEIVRPFVDLVHAPRVLWGVNLGYFLEGLVYFGLLNYLHMYFNEYVGLPDQYASLMVGVLTGGITVSMFFFGGFADKWGVRRALIISFILMFVGRAVLAGNASLAASGGLWSTGYWVAFAALIIIVLGYGMYDPAAYTAVRQFTSPETAAMGYAMLYALMNLGIVVTGAFGPMRNTIGISGAYWVFVGLTLVALVLTMLILTPRTVREANLRLEAKAEEPVAESEAAPEVPPTEPEYTAALSSLPEMRKRVPIHLWLTMLVIAGCVYLIPAPYSYWIWGALAVAGIIFLVLLPAGWRYATLDWLANHPLADGKFYFFIICLIPVQTLFAHQWLTMPMYVERAYAESWPWISKNFEPALALNPLLIFLLVPIIASLTSRTNVYKMMVVGTFIMSAPTFLLALGTTPALLISYIVLMSIGESIWQPRFLQYVTEIAPKDRTGAYVGVARMPWFLTKMIVPLYSGLCLNRYVPEVVSGQPAPAEDPETMWLIYGLIAISSTVMLVLAKPWIAKDFKDNTK